ncbi:H-NS histone family protein [Vibrio fluvialis]|nr:H-NS histone family protein [Vibrio fluvialis]MBY7902406.1 H-NS histone family protein [Vibrio fluvialis]
MKNTSVKYWTLRQLRTLMKGESIVDLQEFSKRVQAVIREREEEEAMRLLEEEERAAKIEEVMKMLQDNGLSINDLKPPKTKAEKKYEYPVGAETKTWSGKGPMPKALQKLLGEGKTLEDFLSK